MISIIIDKNPVPLKRHRHSKNGHTYNPQADLMKQIGWEAKSQFPGSIITTPILVSMTFFIQIPNSLSKRKKLILGGKHVPKRPDLSNYIKFYEDAFNGIIWSDDSLIVELTAKKIYSSNEPRTEINIKEIVCEEESSPT